MSEHKPECVEHARGWDDQKEAAPCICRRVDLKDHVGHRVTFTASGPRRGTITCVDCGHRISTGQTFGRSPAAHQTVTGKLRLGGAVVDGVSMPSTFNIA